MLKISNYCHIKEGKMLLQGQCLFQEETKTGTDAFLKDAFRSLGVKYPKYFKMDTICKLGFLAAEILLKESDIKEKYAGQRTGIMLANDESTLETDSAHQKSISDENNYFPSPAVFVYTLPNIMAGEICIRHKFTGENTFFIFEKFPADFFVREVTAAINEKIMDVCLAGWVSLSKEGDKYEAFMFTIEDNDAKSSIPFETAELQKIYQGKG